MVKNSLNYDRGDTLLNSVTIILLILGVHFNVLRVEDLLRVFKAENETI